MNDLELTLPIGTLAIKIGMPIADVREFYTEIETANTYREDIELKQQSLSYREHGMSFIFRDGALSSLFLYIKAKHTSPFVGKFGCLDETFFSSATVSRFYESTLSDNYVEWFRAYPMSIDMVKGGLRLRYMDNSRSSKILINYSDLTILKTKIEIPLSKKELLPAMMKRLEDAQLKHGLKFHEMIDYKKNCIQCIDELNQGDV